MIVKRMAGITISYKYMYSFNELTKFRMYIFYIIFLMNQAQMITFCNPILHLLIAIMCGINEGNRVISCKDILGES